MSNVKEIINNSIKSIITEEKSAAGVDVVKELKKIGPWFQDNLAGGKDNAVTKQVAINAKKIADDAVAKHEAGEGVGDHLAKAGKKAFAAVKEKAEDAKDAIAAHPGLAAATAAGLAAAVGGLAAVKKMRKSAAKK